MILKMLVVGSTYHRLFAINKFFQTMKIEKTVENT